MRIAVSSEGNSELDFVNFILKPHFEQYNTHLIPIDLRGNLSVDKASREINKLLYGFDVVTTLYDFYGFKKRGNRNIDELEQSLLDQVPADKKQRFIPYVQKYEFEALLFSDPQIVVNELQNPNELTSLQTILKKYGAPENINDGYDTCPSRRLINHFPGYNKKLHGPTICKKIGLPKIRSQCQRFNDWITKLEQLCIK